MRINPISTIPFLKQIRIPLKDKSMGDGRLFKTPMDKIMQIADKNKSPIFIGEDIFILNSSDIIKNALKEAEIKFEEVGDVIE